LYIEIIVSFFQSLSAKPTNALMILLLSLNKEKRLEKKLSKTLLLLEIFARGFVTLRTL
jgi:hypothetical protein